MNKVILIFTFMFSFLILFLILLVQIITFNFLIYKNKDAIFSEFKRLNCDIYGAVNGGMHPSRKEMLKVINNLIDTDSIEYKPLKLRRYINHVHIILIEIMILILFIFFAVIFICIKTKN